MLLDRVSFVATNRKNIKRIQIVATFLLLFVFFGFRGLSVLNDTSSYYIVQQELVNSSDFTKTPFYHINIFERFEPGFQILQRIIGLYVSSEPYALILVTALVITIATIILLISNTNKVALGAFYMLTMGGLVTQYSAMRQAYAVIAFYMIVYCLKERKYISVIILYFLAISFHRTAIILVIPIVLSLFRINRRNLLLGLAAFVVLGYTYMSFVGLFGFSNSEVFSEDSNETFSIGVFDAILTSLMLFLLMLYIYRKYGLFGLNRIYIWSFFLYFCITISSFYIRGFDRFSLYFKPFVVVSLLYLFSRIPIGKRLNFVLATFFLVKFLTVIVLRNEWWHLVPYSFYDFFATYHETEFIY